MLIPFFCCFLSMYHIATPPIGYLIIHVVYVYIFEEERKFGEKTLTKL